MKAEYLQLAQVYNPAKHFIAGWLMSEKLDGIRCFWDGGITRGMRADSVPWANTAKDKSVRYASGLWSRYGKVISSPTWWTNQLPPDPLDMELWTAHDDRQNLVSAVKKHTPIDGQWVGVKCRAFDSPPAKQFLCPRLVKNQHCTKAIDGLDWWINNGGGPGYTSIEHAIESIKLTGIASWIEQVKLPMMTSEIETAISDMLGNVVAKGGEGLMFRNPRAVWTPERTYDMLKYKPLDDCEVEVVGFTWGKETEKGSRHLGRMGGLCVVDPEGRQFTVAGFNDAERAIIRNLYGEESIVGTIRRKFEYEREAVQKFSTYDCWYERGLEYSGKEEPDPVEYQPKMFPIGTTITIKHRGRTNDGIPVEARYWREYSAC